jgi:PAS domain S-box-containing protein
MQGDERGVVTGTARQALRSGLGVPTWHGRPKPSPMMAILIGALIGVAAILAKALLDALIGGPSGYIALTAAAALAAWFAGFRGGATATLVTGLLNALIFLPPAWTFAISGIDLGRTMLFLIGGIVVSWLISSIRASRDRLATSLEEIGSLADDIERRDERLELVLAASGTGFWEWDIRSGALAWSDAVFTQHGLDPSSGSPTFESYVQTIHPDDREPFQRLIQETLASGDAFKLDFRILWPDGSIHWTSGVGRVFRDADGQPIRMIGTGTDITEARRLEDQRDGLLEDERRAGSFREAFVDVISHELRTPITTIFGLTRILQRPGRQVDPVAQAGLIDDIAVESERLVRLVEDLVVLTRAERGEFVVEAEPLELRRLLDRLVETERRRLPGLTITTDIPRNLPVVAGEATYIEQIVRNILSNAAKYTPIGTEVIVRASHEDDMVAVRVLDSGPGLEPGTAERAFELFYRDPTSARAVAGSGIGLFVCASLVEAMGGRIWARTRPEGGAEFGFTLRVLADDESLARSANAELEATPRPRP